VYSSRRNEYDSNTRDPYYRQPSHDYSPSYPLSPVDSRDLNYSETPHGPAYSKSPPKSHLNSPTSFNLPYGKREYVDEWERGVSYSSRESTDQPFVSMAERRSTGPSNRRSDTLGIPSDDTLRKGKSKSNSVDALAGRFEATQVTGTLRMGGIAISDIMRYKDAKVVPCERCNRLLRKGEEVVCVGTAVFHSTCCICEECGLSVDRDQYGSDGWHCEKSGIIICAECMSRDAEGQSNPQPAASSKSPALQAPKIPSPPREDICGTCRLPLTRGTAIVTHTKLKGSHHPKCLDCNLCKRPISDTFGPSNPVHMRQGAPLCHPCYLATLPRCGGCRSIITRDTRVCAALGKKYHPKCFVCAKCSASFPDKSFYVLRDTPFCRWCYHEENGSICGGCRQPIEGPCACVVEGRFHPRCFVCITCSSPLADVYYAYDGKPYCETHILELQRKRGIGSKFERRQTLFRNV
jgi:hypothetical protein